MSHNHRGGNCAPQHAVNFPLYMTQLCAVPGCNLMGKIPDLFSFLYNLLYSSSQAAATSDFLPISISSLGYLQSAPLIIYFACTLPPPSSCETTLTYPLLSLSLIIWRLPHHCTHYELSSSSVSPMKFMDLCKRFLICHL